MTPSEIIIRPASTGDLDSVLSLVRELAVFEKEPDAVTADIHDYEKAFSEGLISIIVATYRSEVVGMAVYYNTFSTWKGKMLYLEDFYVQKDYRNRGIGALIFDEVVQEAHRRQCRMMKWQVLNWNKDAIRFYERYDVTFDKAWTDCKMYFGS